MSIQTGGVNFVTTPTGYAIATACIGGHKSLVFQVEKHAHMYAKYLLQCTPLHKARVTTLTIIFMRTFSTELLVVGIISSQLAYCILGEMPIFAVDRSQHTHNAH